jgi:CTP synthase (UTP-ammonia lyase)
VLGIEDAEHEDAVPGARTLLIRKFNCALVGSTQTIYITSGTLTFQIYGEKKVREQFHCNYGLNEEYRNAMAKEPLKIVGVDTHLAARIVELSNHRFFISTLFLPQLSSTPESTHPLICAFLKAALAFQVIKRESAVKI